jgi:hypothetical protein
MVAKIWNLALLVRRESNRSHQPLLHVRRGQRRASEKPTSIRLSASGNQPNVPYKYLLLADHRCPAAGVRLSAATESVFTAPICRLLF